MRVSEEIRQMIDGKSGVNITLAVGLLDRLEALETNIEKAEKEPHFRTHPEHPELQKLTIAGKLYREYSASYRDTVIKLYKILCDAGDDESISPLREFLKGLETR